MSQCVVAAFRQASFDYYKNLLGASRKSINNSDAATMLGAGQHRGSAGRVNPAALHAAASNIAGSSESLKRQLKQLEAGAWPLQHTCTLSSRQSGCTHTMLPHAHAQQSSRKRSVESVSLKII